MKEKGRNFKGDTKTMNKMIREKLAENETEIYFLKTELARMKELNDDLSRALTESKRRNQITCSEKLALQDEVNRLARELVMTKGELASMNLMNIENNSRKDKK